CSVNFFYKILDSRHSHSSVDGHLWETNFFFFCLFAISWTAPTAYGGSQSIFHCGSVETNLTSVHEDETFPTAPVAYWVKGFLLSSSPSMLYFEHILFLINRNKKINRKEGKLRAWPSKDPKYEKQIQFMETEMNPTSIHEDGHLAAYGSSLQTWLGSCVAVALVKAGSLYGNWVFTESNSTPHFIIQTSPWPLSCSCRLSRPAKKVIYLVFLPFLGPLSLFFNVADTAWILCGCGSRGQEARR
uniref:Gap junction alpha-4 protein n=1 Tax=Sus scrofa TaxID=9823 RepID=A0A4X1VSW3_PIG